MEINTFVTGSMVICSLMCTIITFYLYDTFILTRPVDMFREHTAAVLYIMTFFGFFVTSQSWNMSFVDYNVISNVETFVQWIYYSGLQYNTIEYNKNICIAHS